MTTCPSPQSSQCAASSDVVATCGVITDLVAPTGTPPRRIQLLPLGDVTPNDGRGAWVLADAGAVVRASLAAAPHGVLSIDYDHAADLAAPKGGAAPAAGWITKMEATPNGIWADVEWTDAGARAIASKEYRFLSPSFLHGADRAITRILGAALVNRPALPQLTALASAAVGELMDPTLAALLEALGLPKTADQTAALAAVTALKAAPAPALCAAAGVSGGASVDEIVNAVAAMKANVDQVKAIASAAGLASTASGIDIAAAVATLKANATAATLLETQVATLSSRLKTLEGDKLAEAVDAAIAAGKFVPAQRAELLALAAADQGLFNRLVSTAVPVLQPGQRGVSAPAPGDLTSEQKAVCAAMGISEGDYKATLAATRTGG